MRILIIKYFSRVSIINRDGDASHQVLCQSSERVFALDIIRPVLTRIIAILSSIESIYPKTIEWRKIKKERAKKTRVISHGISISNVRTNSSSRPISSAVGPADRGTMTYKASSSETHLLVRQATQCCDTMIHLFPEQLLLFVCLSLPAPNARGEPSAARWYALILMRITKRKADLRETIFSIWYIQINYLRDKYHYRPE